MKTFFKIMGLSAFLVLGGCGDQSASKVDGTGKADQIEGIVAE